jgi:hypothetical protein
MKNQRWISLAFKKIKIWINKFALVIGFIAGAITIVLYVECIYMDKIVPRFFPWIDVQELPGEIPSNQYIISGRYEGLKEDLKVRVYIWPDDFSDRYWLQMPRMNYAYKKKWAELCYFGNPKRIDHYKINPTFYVYAVLVKASCVDSLPGAKSNCPWVEATGEFEFIKKIKSFPGVKAVSSPVPVKRTDATCPELEIVSPSLTQDIDTPVTCQWKPNRRMYVQLFNSGCKIFEGNLHNNSRIPLVVDSTKSPYFLIIISDRPGNQCEASTWFCIKK